MRNLILIYTIKIFFSSSILSINYHLMVTGIVQTRQGQITLPENAATTSNALFFFNDLFDSFNGKQRQRLSSIISSNRRHVQFWKKACDILRNM